MSHLSDFSGAEKNTSLKVLFAASEALPLIKTGGLADIAGSLPPALHALKHDVRLILPAYPEVVEKTIPLKEVALLHAPGRVEPIRLLSGMLPGHLPLYLVDAPGLFDRPGNPYVGPDGHDWPDNAQRFAVFCRAVAAVGLNQAGQKWQPDIIHCNDWQTGLVPPLVHDEGNRPATLFTVHNLAYQGNFDREVFASLRLPSELWSSNGLEFHDNLSFIKGGLAFADQITTVSPTYANEICTPQFGYGFEGLLQHNRDRLTGILNGIDYQHWDPASDPLIHQHYDTKTFNLKHLNKLLLQREMGLLEDKDVFLLGYVGRLVEQKGIDLIMDILPRLTQIKNIQLALLGSGLNHLEKALSNIGELYPGKVAVHIGYSEQLAHRIEAGCDCFLMPSRFEPCGLNQLYSLRYGSVPIVRRTGGLADTVIDVDTHTLLNGTATGFVFDEPTADALWDTVQRAIEFRQRPEAWWHKLATTGMEQDFSWSTSAGHYLDLYREAILNPIPNPVKS
ncbi:Glycogen synthase, ADP-glucose transglucosylase [hydrothermal vent metagenome]|uniref:starch synthase n=1 Tax=hydrothermal vent metagenome TaxID=652676 RepID=A0A3B1B6N5_9ZZZZ